LSGSRGASFDRNRVPSSASAAGQHAALQTIDTACHAVRGVTGSPDFLADGRALVDRFHMNTSVTPHRTRGPGSRNYFPAAPTDRQCAGGASV
jgi:hypothetical protein